MITSGFFDSVSGDRVYNAEQMSEYFKGLISDGVLMNVGDMLQVIAGSGMTVKVKTGRAFILSHWIELDDIETVNITAAHATLSRYTTIVARLSADDREITITSKDGTPASSPTAPALTRTDEVWEIGLANVLVRPGATSIAQQYIVDTRPDSSRCGFVTGLITQLDTSQLWAQWEAAYNGFYIAFQNWFETLTQELQVNTYIKQWEKRVTGTAAQVAQVALDMAGYTFDPHDIFFVSVNGLEGAAGTDYQIREDGVILISIGANRSSNNSVLVKVLKSVIGNPPESIPEISAQTTFTVDSE